MFLLWTWQEKDTENECWAGVDTTAPCRIWPCTLCTWWHPDASKALWHWPTSTAAYGKWLSPHTCTNWCKLPLTLEADPWSPILCQVKQSCHFLCISVILLHKPPLVTSTPYILYDLFIFPCANQHPDSHLKNCWRFNGPHLLLCVFSLLVHLSDLLS